MIRPVILVTGFLGAGKTTLALKLIQAGQLQDAVMIVNDFGDASFDSIQIGSTGMAYRAMDGGCICCTVKGDLLKTLHEIPVSFPNKNLIWIEASGISDPSDILSLFYSSSFISESYSMRSVLTVVDGRNSFDWLIQQQSAPQQIAMASDIVVNTYDQLNKDLESLSTEIKIFNPIAQINLICLAKDQLAAIEDLAWFKNHRAQDTPSIETKEYNRQHKHAFETLTIRWQGRIKELDVITFLNQWIEEFGVDLLRLKGTVQTVERDQLMVVQGVRRQVTFDYEDVDWPVENFLVIIGENIDRDSVDQLAVRINTAITISELEV